MCSIRQSPACEFPFFGWSELARNVSAKVKEHFLLDVDTRFKCEVLGIEEFLDWVAISEESR